MKKALLFSLAGLCLFVYGLLLFGIPLPSSRAAPTNAIDTGHVTDASRVVIRDGSSDIGLYTSEDALYQTRDSGAAGATEFLSQDPQVEGERLLPRNFLKSVRMYRQNRTGNESHFFYQQTVNGVPVYASQLAVHQREGNQIYSLQGNVVTDARVLSGGVTKDQAKMIALAEAGKVTDAPLQVAAVEKLIFNGLAIGVNDDPHNYLAHVVAVKSVDAENGFGRKYFVSTLDGTILFSEDLTREAMNRKVNSCNNSANCTKGRYEGDPAKGIADIDLAYDTLGNYYNFLKSSFNRDSYDGQGAPLIANIDFFLKDICPNAWSEGSTVYVCKGLVAPDVISHEMTHSMNHSGPAFVYANQSGAIDEGLADVYATAIDNNWTMGETTQDGIARSLADPAKYGQPDRLFSARYFCESGQDKDEGGVHTNGGILGKAFYLMVNGGNFNGCTVAGVGKDKAYDIIYRAEMSYMTASSNYKTVYNAVIQACGDLYGGVNSADCIQVRNSLRAVEMDQQTDGSQKSPVCTGGHEAKPDCSTAPVNTSTPVPTGAPAATPTTAQTTTPTPTPASTSAISVHLKLRLQGLFGKPQNASPVSFKVRMTGKGGQTVVNKTVSFTWLSTGAVEGTFGAENTASGDGYVLYVKGPLHLERKICGSVPVEIAEGRYACNGDTLTLHGGMNEVDATGILQLAGDIPDEAGRQDNTINSYDLSLIRNNFGTRDANLIKRLDVNYDGVVDSRDFDLANMSSTVVLER